MHGGFFRNMPRLGPRTAPAAHLRRTDPDYHQALARVVIVTAALLFAFSPFYARHAPDTMAVHLGRMTGVLAGIVTALILLSFTRWPRPSKLRRLAGITHDVCANSVAVYLGGAGTGFFTVAYVVIILASAVRFGAAYMAYAALCSLVGFGLIHMFSPYWGSNVALSINVVLVLTVVPAYMYPLIRARQRGRQELERRATHDSLTGLMNRAGFEQQLEQLVVPQHPAQVLIYFDLDRFKAVNDMAGHAAGDRLLSDVARIVRECVRAEDVCGRIGGDEFAVLMQQCTLALGTQVATRIKERIHAHRLDWDGAQYSVGASVGVVSSMSIEDAPSFLRLADAACYAAKNAGRNTIHVVDTARLQVDTGELRALHLKD
jgi:diguanylate cyclase (GGDEF)-like protein